MVSFFGEFSVYTYILLHGKVLHLCEPGRIYPFKPMLVRTVQRTTVYDMYGATIYPFL
jgi:hypothetical protein